MTADVKIKDALKDFKVMKTAIDSLDSAKKYEENTFVRLRKKYKLGDQLGNRDALLDTIKETIADIFIKENES